MSNEAVIRSKFSELSPVMNERVRRLWAAGEAKALGYGGISVVARATGLSRVTITAGLGDLQALEQSAGQAWDNSRIRCAGGGRKGIVVKDPGVLEDLRALVEPVTRGDPQSALQWTSKRAEKLAVELQQQGHAIKARTVAKLLHELNYSLQAPRKTQEGRAHPDRNAQFEYIQQQLVRFKRRRQAAISVDTKKKELVGDFKNGGQEWRPKGEPVGVRVHDFVDKVLGKAIPYGVYDVLANQGWVSVGIHHDTAEFATEAIRRWWHSMGLRMHAGARDLLIIADGGGSNGSRSRLWKVCLQKLADTTRLRIWVCHFPPGTSKWNKIEHRMFAPITQNWRGRPLMSLDVILNLISHTTTRTGLMIKAQLDTTPYQAGIKVTNQELAAVRLKKADFHGEWNYRIAPRRL